MIRQDFTLLPGHPIIYEGWYQEEWLTLCTDAVAKRFPEVIQDDGSLARAITFKLFRKKPEGPSTHVRVSFNRSTLGTVMGFAFSPDPYDVELTGLWTGLVIDKRLGRPDSGTEFWVQVEVGGGDGDA